MIIEAMRAYLVGLGIPGAEDWSVEEISKYIDEILLEQIDNPEAFNGLVQEMQDAIATNLRTFEEVLTEGH